MSGSKGFAGVYESLSVQKSTEEHKALSASLRKAMRERGFFETEAMSTRRKEVVKTITKVPCSKSPQSMLLLSDSNNSPFQQVCEDWIREILLAEPMHASKDPCEQFQLRVYGSYRLDAHLPNADIDSVVMRVPFTAVFAICRCSHPRVQRVEVHRQGRTLPRAIQALRSHAARPPRPSRIAQVHHRC
jgi:hypothetical protein